MVLRGSMVHGADGVGRGLRAVGRQTHTTHAAQLPVAAHAASALRRTHRQSVDTNIRVHYENMVSLLHTEIKIKEKNMYKGA